MKLFAVIGKSFSGKTTLINNILKDKGYCKECNLYRLPLYTDRKPRENEEDGVENIFLFKEEMKSMIKENENFIYTSYNTEYGELRYGINLSEILGSSNNYICDVPVELLYSLKNKLKENLFIIYLCPPNYTLIKRLNQRNDNVEYSNKKWQEISRRYSDDLYKFSMHSNEYVSNSYGIIHLGEFISVDDIKFRMEYFINYPPTDPFYYNIILKNGSFRVFTNYTPKVSSTITNMINGKILICNGDAIIDTNNEVVYK